MRNYVNVTVAHDAKADDEKDGPMLVGKAMRDYNLLLVTIWDTTDAYFSDADMASTKAVSQITGLLTTVDQSRAWISTCEQDTGSALGVPTKINIGFYSDSALNSYDRSTPGKKPKKGNAVHLLQNKHWGWTTVRRKHSGWRCMRSIFCCSTNRSASRRRAGRHNCGLHVQRNCAVR